MTNHDRASVFSLLRFGLNSADSKRLLDFYARAFSARVVSRERQDLADLNGWPEHIGGGVICTVLRLGESAVEIREFDDPGGPYPDCLSPYDSRFQHFGIVVADMQQAMAHLSGTAGWTAISTDGPQSLPARSGAVTAFKFRDPDGHPLELLEFSQGRTPAHWTTSTERGLFKGIDHSAISIANIDRSVLFYQSLGLQVTSRSLNEGLQQQLLDGEANPHVDVVGLAPAIATPHVELLHYRGVERPRSASLAYNDIAATRLVFGINDAAVDTQANVLKDPDGHFIELRNR